MLVIDDELKVLAHGGDMLAEREVAAPSTNVCSSITVDDQGCGRSAQRQSGASLGMEAAICICEAKAAIERGDESRPLAQRDCTSPRTVEISRLVRARDHMRSNTRRIPERRRAPHARMPDIWTKEARVH